MIPRPSAEDRAGNVIDAPFGTGSEGRRSVLDRAHRGDIIGAVATVTSGDTGPRRSWRRRAVTLLAVMGPGVVVMVADNDAGGISTYAQVGQDHGLRYLWLLGVLAVFLFVNQEMVARLGAVTGAGHARLISERFGRRWGGFALGDLVAVNLLVLVTEFIGVALGVGYFGVSRYVSVPLAALALIAVGSSGSFRRWERAMYTMVATSLVVLPLLTLVHHHVSPLIQASRMAGAPPPGTVLVVVALVGTTVAPWQLFFHQSNVVDKRITPRWLAYERGDTVVGTLLFAGTAAAVMAACAIGLSGVGVHGTFVDAGQIAVALRHQSGEWAGALFAVALVNGSVLGAGAVTLSTSYAVGDVCGTRHSLHRGWADARTFHRSYASSILVAAAVVLVPGAPLEIVTVGVQALAGILLPSALIFLLLLCNDRTVLGPWVNPTWLNIGAASVVGVLLTLSGLLSVVTLFPHLTVTWPCAVVAGSVTAAVGGLAGWRLGSAPTAAMDRDRKGRAAWTMPAIDTLARPAPSTSRTVGLVALRVYLVCAAGAVALRVAQLIAGS